MIYRSIALIIACASLCSTANAQIQLDGVAVSPFQPNTSTPVSLIVSITTPGGPAFLVSPTSVSLNNSSFAIRVFPDYGPQDVTSHLDEVVNLGILSPGIYNFSINLYGVIDIPPITHFEFPILDQPVIGSFTVVPEPSSFVLAALGVLGFARPVHRRSA